jgi:hypothetical protein
MPQPSFGIPRLWAEEQLAADRAISISRFIDERSAADPARWAEEFEGVRELVERVFVVTNDLRAITAEALLAEPGLWHVLRYCCGPPVSEEDLWTYVGGPTFKRVPPLHADRTAEVFRSFVDDVRFPWIALDREPTADERACGLAATIMPLTQQRFATRGRGAASQRQESMVAAALADAGFDLNDAVTDLWGLDELARGSYSRERKLAGAKCDVPLRLRDGRILAIECKASHGPKNGWKRLVREVAGKSETWRSQFGTQVVTAAVLAGVYDVSCLRRGQESHVAIFWEHDLAALTEFATSV